MAFAGRKEQRTILIPEPYGELDNDFVSIRREKKRS